MLATGFTSTINNYKKLELGRTEKLFLSIISLENTSAYLISSRLKNGYIVTRDGRLYANIKPMAYKNVHKRVKRLYSLGLIEKIEGNFSRNAIMYKLTTRGLLEQLLDVSPLLPDIYDVYRSDPIIETLVYQNFELETIASFEDIPKVELRNYLRKCCEEILSTLDAFRYESKFFERLSSSNHEFNLKQHDGLFPEYMDVTIRNEIKSFVFKIVNMSKDIDPYESEKNNRNLFPRQALLKDKRFIGLLKEIKKNFENGCKNYL